jgi:integrase
MARGSVEKLPSGRHRARWPTREGKMASKTFTLKTDAEKFLHHAIVAEERRQFEPAQPEPEATAPALTFDQATDEWWDTVEHSVKPRTAERYEDHLTAIRRELGPLGLVDVDGKTLQRFVATLQQTYSPKTVRACMGVVLLVLGHAHRMGDLDRLPPKPRLPRVEKPTLTIPTRAQVDQLATASDGRLVAPVLVAGYCGLREGELLALLRSDVHLDESPAWLLVRHARNKTSGKTESTKTGRVRRVYLPAPVRAALTEHLDEFDSDLVVPVTASVLQKSWQRARKACSLDAVRFHDLRHAAASMMIAAGLNVLQVSKQLGHANPTQTLDVYGHLWPDSFDDAMLRMDTYLGHSPS